MPRLHHASRNPFLIKGVQKYSRTDMYRRSGRAEKKKSGVPWKTVEKKKEEVALKEKPFNEKKNEKRVIKPKAPRFYPEFTVRRPLKSRKSHHRPTRLRKSITPGTVLIVLVGRFRGKRVIFLKQLPSGLLLVTGPFKVNGVPVRRLNQTYVIATSTKVDISGLEIPKKFKDDYFRRPKQQKKQQTEEDFFATETKKKTLDPTRIQDQKDFDKKVLAVVEQVPHLAEYLNAKFSLKKGQHAHELKF